MTTFQTLIITDGDIPPFDILVNLNYTTLLCLDGAASVLQRNKVKPDIILGDLDSLLKQYDSIKNIQSDFPQSRIIHTPDQNKTDFEKGLDYVLQHNTNPTLCVGLFGKALDHTLYNLSVFARYSQKLPLSLLHTFENQKQWGFMLPPKCCIHTQISTTISIYPLTESTISSDGLEWELNNTKLSPLGMQSTRNKAISNQIKLETQGDCLYLQHSEQYPTLEF